MKPIIVIMIAVVCLTSTRSYAQYQHSKPTPGWVYAVGGITTTVAGALYFMYKRSKNNFANPRLKLDEIEYITTPAELREIPALITKKQIDEYVNIFWQRRDPTSETPDNEFKTEYYERLEYANKHLGNIKPGWKTDRGRVYILYGPPDEIDHLPWTAVTLSENLNINAIEVWLYHEPAAETSPNAFDQVGLFRRKFIFADIYGYGDYKQIYSNASGEVLDPRVYTSAINTLR